MALEDSILKSVKKDLNVAPDDDSFDSTLINHINSGLNSLNDLGIGVPGFMIEDDSSDWDEFTLGDPNFNSARTYMYQWVRIAWDAPATSFGIEAAHARLKEEAYRLNMRKETAEWPTTSSYLT